MILIPSIIKKNNEILPPPIKSIMVKSVMVTLSYRQPVIKKKSEPKPNPKQAVTFTPKQKSSPVLKKKNLVKLPKKAKQNKPVIHKQKELTKKPLTPVKTITVKAAVAEPEQIKAEKKETIKQAHIEFAKLLYKKNSLPAYPVIAQRRGYQGIVELMVLVSEKGKISSLKIFKSSGYNSLDRQAVKTVKHWFFEPGKNNGIPQEMWVKIPVKFELK